jgi:hypothetical protein
MKIDNVPTNFDCIKLVQARNEEFFAALAQFLRGFDEQYRQMIFTEFIELEFDYIRN